MTLARDISEDVQSASSAAQDIQRTLMLIALSGKASEDRKIEIRYAADRIAELVNRL